MTGKGLALTVVVALLLGPALLLTLQRILEPSWGAAVQAVAFTPFGLPLYAAALVLLGVVMAVGRTFAPAYLVPALVAAAGLTLHAIWFAPLRLGEAPAPAAGAERTVVMTSNVLRGRADAAELVAMVRNRDVDVLVVNEITGSFLADMEAAGVSELLPERAGEPGPEEDVVGTMVFSKESTRLVARLPTKLDSLVVETGGMRLFAVHPMSPMWPDDWRADHVELLGATRTYKPDLIVGDFNATPDHAPMRALGDAGYRDAVELTNGGFAPTWPDNGGFGLLGVFGPVAQIDHVLVSERWTATEAETLGLAGSDHHPVVAEVARR